jgi:divalent metal cation (Fe/Co/Zn/Cd) transporter
LTLDPHREALRVSWLSIAVGTASGAASTVLGLQAASLALVGSGATVLVDVSSSAVLVWRFLVGHRHERAERWAHSAAAWALLVLAMALAATSLHRLVGGGSTEATAGSVVVAVAALLVLPVLARAKYRAAARVGSGALRTDAHITSVGAATALLGLAGLVGSAWGAEYADAAAALLVALVAGATGGVELRRR